MPTMTQISDGKRLMERLSAWVGDVPPVVRPVFMTCSQRGRKEPGARPAQAISKSAAPSKPARQGVHRHFCPPYGALETSIALAPSVIGAIGLIGAVLLTIATVNKGHQNQATDPVPKMTAPAP